MPTITAFESSPDEGQGHARDMRVRWAFEEVGQPYEVSYVRSRHSSSQSTFRSIPSAAFRLTRTANSFFSSPGSDRCSTSLEKHEGLLPVDPDGRARAITWMFAALNTVEPPIVEWEAFMLLEKDKFVVPRSVERSSRTISETVSVASPSTLDTNNGSMGTSAQRTS